MGFLSRCEVIRIVEDAITGRKVLSVKYKHSGDGEIVVHQIAPFDIGTTNPTKREQNKNNLYAYSFTHIDDKKCMRNPKVCVFNLEQFLNMESTSETFDETDLAIKNFQATKYDYRTCCFALLPNRNWFNR
jgi:hypothetical protein